MNWRLWARTELQNHGGLTALVPAAQMHAAGSLQGAPAAKPFIVISIGVEDVVFNNGDAPEVTTREGVIWVHDHPGSYDLIDEALVQVRAALVKQVTGTGGIACQWVGDSDELSNPDYRTICRNANFRLHGRT